MDRYIFYVQFSISYFMIFSAAWMDRQIEKNRWTGRVKEREKACDVEEIEMEGGR